jgi:hypothetical protein
MYVQLNPVACRVLARRTTMDEIMLSRKFAKKTTGSKGLNARGNEVSATDEATGRIHPTASWGGAIVISCFGLHNRWRPSTSYWDGWDPFCRGLLQ